jgi:hypothetical protein
MEQKKRTDPQYSQQRAGIGAVASVAVLDHLMEERKDFEAERSRRLRGPEALQMEMPKAGACAARRAARRVRS